MKVKLLSRVQLLATGWTAAYQAPLSMGFSKQEYWSGVPLPSPIYIYIHKNTCVCVYMYIYMSIYILLILISLISCYKIFSEIPYAIEKVLVVYPFYI